MKTTTYRVKLNGVTPLLMHHDNLSWSEQMKAWTIDPANREGSTAGDDRSPAWRWIGNLYVEGGSIVIPADNLMTMLREGGKRCMTGKGQQTFKSQTQSGLVVDQAGWCVESHGKVIPYKPFLDLVNNPDFAKHETAAVENGFMLFVKRAKVGPNKHVRVRPRFDSWTCAGTITVLDENITRMVFEQILTFAGNYAGLGDWRPSSPKSPGPFGKFTVEIKGA